MLIVLPYAMMSRNFIEAGVLERLAERGGAEVTIVSPSASDAARAEGLGMQWEPLFHPLRWPGAPRSRLVRWLWYLRYLAGTAWRMALVNRFNAIQGFRGFAIRLRQSLRLRMRFIAEGLPMSRLFGMPFPRSPALYATLYRAYYSGWQRFPPVDALVRRLAPRLIVLAHLQTPVVTPYVLAARRGAIPILGLNGSWDQPTTKGPLCPGLARILVQNEQVRAELRRHHDVPEDRIVTVGWPQMDAYADESRLLPRERFLAQSGFDAGERYVVLAANPGRLSYREPEIAAWIARRLHEGRYGANVRLHVRCHPNDLRWRERFGALAAQPSIRLEPPRGEDLAQLANLLRHAELVIASAGSINLDAIALDTPTIGLAWEDEALPYWDRQARAYDFEHLAAVAGGPGFPLARSAEDLERLIAEALQDRARGAAARRELRRKFLEPLDGRASDRIAAEILRMAAAA